MKSEFKIENKRNCTYLVQEFNYRGNVRTLEIDLRPNINPVKRVDKEGIVLKNQEGEEITKVIGDATPILTNWMCFAELCNKEGDFIPASAPVIHAFLKCLYENRANPKYSELIEKACNEFRESSLLRGSIGTLSVTLLKNQFEEENKIKEKYQRIFGDRKNLDDLIPKKTDSIDVVLHDLGTPLKYEIKANLLPGTWRTTGKSLTQVVREENTKLKELFAETCKALLDDDYIDEVDSIYRWLGFEEVQLACTTRKKLSESEVGVIGFSQWNNQRDKNKLDFWINGANYDALGEFKKNTFAVLMVR